MIGRAGLCNPASILTTLAGKSHLYPYLNELVNNINHATDNVHTYNALADTKRARAPPCRLASQLTPDRQVVARGNSSELVFIQWQPGQVIPKHTYVGQLCWIRVLCGSLNETIYGAHGPSKRTISASSPPAFINDGNYTHLIENRSLTPSVSVHLYKAV
jgi:hypothetical protein